MSIKSSPQPQSAKKTVRKNSNKGDSSLKQHEENLPGSSDIYRTLVENLNEVVFSLTLKGNFTYINPVIEKLSGYQVDQVIGKSFDIFVYPDDLPGLKSSFKRTLTGESEP
jgi:PAS domain-containing protein